MGCIVGGGSKKSGVNAQLTDHLERRRAAISVRAKGDGKVEHKVIDTMTGQEFIGQPEEAWKLHQSITNKREMKVKMLRNWDIDDFDGNDFKEYRLKRDETVILPYHLAEPLVDAGWAVKCWPAVL